MTLVTEPSAIEVCNIPFLPYQEGLALQQSLSAEIREGTRPETLLLVEHPPVITCGRGWRPEHLLASREELSERGVEVFESDRGGDVTYHGPGQLVGYPLLDLARRGRDVHAYLRRLESVLNGALSAYGLRGERIPGLTGVWVSGRKIAAIGVHVRGWVTSHGFSLNVEDSLEDFSLIVPCGLHGREVTSIERETGCRPSMPEARTAVIGAFESVFSCETADLPLSSLPPAAAG